MKLTTEQTTELKSALAKMKVCDIARVIQQDWVNVWFGAVPYLREMHGMITVKDPVFNDDGRSVINYFIGNAKCWRGDVAKLVKDELRRRLKERK